MIVILFNIQEEFNSFLSSDFDYCAILIITTILFFTINVILFNMKRNLGGCLWKLIRHLGFWSFRICLGIMGLRRWSQRGRWNSWISKRLRRGSRCCGILMSRCGPERGWAGWKMCRLIMSITVRVGFRSPRDLRSSRFGAINARL